MAKQDDKPKDPRELRRQVREIADSLAIAFILAMVIRHYVLEVFKIPTKSMEPTLLGDPWSGDKILVNKFAYDFRGPRRWEIAVFKYPMDTSKNYIKRVVGLPGETIRVRYGDVFINGAIARKPWHVQRDIWRLCPHSGEARSWQSDGSEATPNWKLSDGEFAADSLAAQGAMRLSYGRDILAYESPDDPPHLRQVPRLPTSDIMVQFQLVPHAMAGSASVEIGVVEPPSRDFSPREPLDVWTVEFPLGKAECRPEVRRGDALFAVGDPCKLAQGRPALVQVCNVDRTFIVRVDGREILRKDYEPSPRVFEWNSYITHARVALLCAQSHVAFRNAGVYVDVYYTDNPDDFAVRKPYQLGPDDYFVLGDNSVNSNDSRKWEKVPRSYLVGEAFLVLWPLGRMKPVR